ncbi:Transcription elongation factor SPT4, partial [Fragariocoptes setiger]
MAGIEALPRELHNLRACLMCKLIKQFDQFEKYGCDNCEEFLGMRGNKDVVFSCTTSSFDGMIAICKPEDSWVARWQRVNRKVRGMYAVSVSGKIPSALRGSVR